MRDPAGRAAVAAPQGQAGGRHERRPYLVEVTGGRPAPARRATRATRSRHAAPAGWAAWAERAERVAGQARAWWAEGTERAAARARERWDEQVAATRQRGTAGRPTHQTRTGVHPTRRRGTGGRPTPIRAVAGGSGPRPVEAGRSGSWPGSSSEPVAAASAGSRPGTRAAGGGASRATRVAGQPTGPAPRHLAEAPRARRAGWREDAVTGWCSVLLVLGLYLDGWKQVNLVGGGSGTSLTPWHGVLSVGFVATAAWILTRDQRRGAWSLRAVPPGYRLALVGVALAMVAVAGDAVWHMLSGAEPGLGRLVSPSHLVLFAGTCLLVSSPLRAAWSGPSPARVPGLRAFWPVLLSTTLVVALTAFFFQQVSPVVAGRPGPAGLPAGSPLAATVQGYELLGLLLHNLLFVAPVLLLLLRWQTPLGTFTVMAGSVASLLASQSGLGLVGLVGAAVLGGAAADVAVTLLRPSPQRRWAARAVAVIAPAVYWTSHFALLKAGYGVGWELELWLGAVVWASLSGLTLALLMWPPAVPLTAWNRGRSAGRPPAPVPMPASMPARMVGR
jgi:hypothetical protein